MFFESPANPNMRLVDIAAIAAIARRHGAQTVVDNTYCTPYLQRPIELGADFVLHSATKYLGGHGDLLAGAIVGPKETLDHVRFHGLKDMTGAVLSSQDAFLVLRGLKTLNLRMDRHCTNAQGVAEFLAAHPKVAVVHFPGLPSFPQFALAQRQMAQPGGMIAFELKDGIAAGRRFMNALQLFTRAVSLGDAESLAQHPASMTHAFYTLEEREHHLIGEGLVRLSVGLEDLADLVADLRQALDSRTRLPSRQRRLFMPIVLPVPCMPGPAEPFADTLKAEIEALPAGSLPLDKATLTGWHIDDSHITATVLRAEDDATRIAADVGIFFTEIIAGCSCGDEPQSQGNYCELAGHHRQGQRQRHVCRAGGGQHDVTQPDQKQPQESASQALRQDRAARRHAGTSG